MKVAACKYAIGEPSNFAEFASKQERLLREAKHRGAELAVLPEYLSLELAAMFDDATRGDLHASLAAIQPLRDDWLSLYAGLARELGIGIV
ncbi:MAG: nitrilase, partial [Thermomonas sp.]